MALPARHRRVRRAGWRPAQLTTQPVWSHRLVEEAAGSWRLEVTDEDGATLPVARQLSRGQADLLLERIVREARQEHKPIKAVIRDPYFMAATVITVKRVRLD